MNDDQVLRRGPIVTEDEYDARAVLAHRIFGGLPPVHVGLHKAYQGADVLITALHEAGFEIVRKPPKPDEGSDG